MTQARSATAEAKDRLCSDSRTDKPSDFRRRTASAICLTISGANPSEGSSSRSSDGLPISVRANVSICCSPPLIRVPRRPRISARLGNSANSFSGVQAGAPGRGGWRPTSRFSSTVRSAKMRRSSGT